MIVKVMKNVFKAGDIVTWAGSADELAQFPFLDPSAAYMVTRVMKSYSIMLDIPGDEEPRAPWNNSYWKLAKEHYVNKFIERL